MSSWRVLSPEEIARLVPKEVECFDLTKAELRDRLEQLALSHEGMRSILDDFVRRERMATR